jgi:hypothetical protein
MQSETTYETLGSFATLLSGCLVGQAVRVTFQTSFLVRGTDFVPGPISLCQSDLKRGRARYGTHAVAVVGTF